MNESHVRVQFRRPLKWGGVMRQPGYEAGLPGGVAQSLLRHGAVVLASTPERTPQEHAVTTKPAPAPKRATTGTKPKKGKK
jgi:hypothetical protein